MKSPSVIGVGLHNFVVLEAFPCSVPAYPELFAIVGPTVPDLRGLFLRGYGSQSHSQNNGTEVGVTATLHSSGPLGTIQGDAIRNIEGEHKDVYGHYQDKSDNLFVVKKGRAAAIGGSAQGNMAWDVTFDASHVVPTAEENRPVNVAVRYLIRAV